MKKFTNMIVGVFCALLLGVSALADNTNSLVTPQSAWVVSLGGSGETVTAGNRDTAFGVDLSVGRTGNLLLPLEAGVRQSVSYDTTDTVLATKVYADWTLISILKQKLDVFAGANAGLTYGDVPSVWTAAPEAGFRIWVKDDVAILGRAEFPFRLNNGADYTDTVKYFLGFQIRW